VYSLTAYDATYLELVLRTGGTLATFDRQLATAVRKAGVRVFGDAP
jgi:predicted nucleic acid-binding protein